MGRELFERRPRGVVPTSVAHQLAAQVSAAPGRAGRRSGSGCPRPDQSPEPAHVAGSAELLCTRLLPALAPLTGEGVRLRVSPGLTGDLLDGLRGGRFDW
ncbi:hypothetical protein ACFWP5_11570 [Streptomyces sp. NPDC058469]|uniref:hypothetical protein n=1 Tax=Streptomyces sp. NPDC058469 TaxID=3346514 RepID=UPI003658B3B7